MNLFYFLFLRYAFNLNLQLKMVQIDVKAMAHHLTTNNSDKYELLSYFPYFFYKLFLYFILRLDGDFPKIITN